LDRYGFTKQADKVDSLIKNAKTICPLCKDLHAYQGFSSSMECTTEDCPNYSPKRADEVAKEYGYGEKDEKMKTINLYWHQQVPKNFTGIAIYPNGDKYWYVEGKRSRLDGPAVEWADGSKVWYVEGKRSRLDGPAVEWADGSKAWYVKGNQFDEADYWQQPEVIDWMKKHRP
jgi:hypothetical protein